MNCTVTVKDIYGEGFTKLPTGYTYIDPFNNFRIPQAGDTFLSPKYEVCTLEEGDVTPKGPRVILKKLNQLTVESVYGNEPVVAPAGYALDEFRKLRKGETASWLVPGGTMMLDLIVDGLAGEYRYTLKKLPVKPKFKVGDKVTTKDVNDAGVGVIESILPEMAWATGTYYKINYKDSWYGRCTEPEVSLSAYVCPEPRPTPLSVYGTATPTPPKGYALGEFKKLGMEDLGKWFLGNPRGMERAIEVSVAFTLGQTYRYLLNPIPTQPAKAPEGYYFTGEYRKPKEGEWILDNGGQAWRCRMDFENDSHFILKPLPPKPTRWLIEVESEEKPEGVEVFARTVDYFPRALAVLSITPKP